MENLTGQSLKGYDLSERIGSGGFGAVYRAYQTTIGREVAVKVILPGYANRPDFIRRFEAEAQLIARLEHLHIVPLYDYWRQPGSAYLVMRWLRGGSARDALGDGPFGLESAALLLDQICAALAVAHDAGVVHRDVKPSNILLDEEGNAYLADFGIAADLRRGDGDGREGEATIGSPAYLAPEQARGESVTPQTDIYSLGVTLYELLSAAHPFGGRNKIELLYKQINEPLPPLTTLAGEVGDDVNAVIQRATLKNPHERYGDAPSMAVAFRKAARLKEREAEELAALLTMRERDVLHLIAAGLTNRQIAQELYVEHSTVKWYIRQIYGKLDVRSRRQAVVRAREMQLASAETAGPETETTGAIIPLPALNNPYKGLRAFAAADRTDFFGREALLDRLLQRLQLPPGATRPARLALADVAPGRGRFLAIVGPSGSGKSSLVRAGLVPALWEGQLSGSDRWYVVEMTPGQHPLDELEVALMRVAADQAGNLHELLTRDANGLLRAAQLILPKDDSELALVIDHFEELFSLVEDDEERSFFLSLLATAVTAQRSRVRVILTLRADYYDRPLHYRDFGQLVRRHMETVLPLKAEELERAIIRPAEALGVAYEPGLVAAIIDDALYQPGALPLLQYALTELFEARAGRNLTHQAYADIGGVTGALTKRAEELYLEQDEAGRELIHQIFLRLVTASREDNAMADTRRRVTQSELLSLNADEDLVEEIIDLFAAYRLLTLDHEPSSRRPTVEVAHEALLREWHQLREWVDESRTDIRLQRQLARATREWAESHKDLGFLLRDARLDQFAGWAEDTTVALTQEERSYLQASIAAREARLAAEEARRQKELETARKLAELERKRAEEQEANAVKLRQEIRRAEEQASIGLAALAREELEGASPERGLLLALAALEEYPYTAQAAGALTLALEKYRPLHVLDSTGSIGDMMEDADWSPDGKRVAAGGVESPMSIVIWDAATGNELLSVEKHSELCEDEGAIRVIRLAWSPSGEHIVSVALGGTLRSDCGAVVFDSISGEILVSLSGYDSRILALGWSPIGMTVLTGHEDGTATLWDAETGAKRWTLSAHDLPVRDIAFSPNGGRFATASEDGTAVLWDAESGQELLRLRGHAGPVRSLDWSPDGARLVTGGNDDLPRIWDTTSGEVLLVLSGHTDDVVEVEWSPDGGRIATQSLDFTVKLWDAASGGLLCEIRNAGPHWLDQYGYVSFSPDGKQLLTGASRLMGQVHIWDVSNLPLRLFGHTTGIDWGGWSPDGRLIATSGMDHSTRLWDANTGEQLHVLDNIFSRWSDWSPDSKRLAMPDDRRLLVVDAKSGEVLSQKTAAREGTEILSANWSPDGSRIAVAELGYGIPLAVYIVDAETLDLLSTLQPGETCSPVWAEWSPDSRKIVTTCHHVTKTGLNTPTRIWDATTGEILKTLESEHGWSVRARWSPDGERLLVTYDQGVARIWDVEREEAILTFAGHVGRVWTGAWSPDGERIATTDVSSRQVKVWDAETGKEIVNYPVPGDALTIDWSPDGERILITGDGFNEPIIKRVFASAEELIAHARQCCVTRKLTAEERAQFGLLRQ